MSEFGIVTIKLTAPVIKLIGVFLNIIPNLSVSHYDIDKFICLHNVKNSCRGHAFSRGWVGPVCKNILEPQNLAFFHGANLNFIFSNEYLFRLFRWIEISRLMMSNIKVLPHLLVIDLSLLVCRLVAFILSYDLKETLFHNINMSWWQILVEHNVIDVVVLLLKAHHDSSNLVMPVATEKRDLKEKLKHFIV